MIESLKTPEDRLKFAYETADFQSAAELAERSGLKEARVRHYLNGTRDLTNDAAEALARPLNCDASWLMFGTGKAPSKLPPDELPPRNFSLAEVPPKPDFQHTIEVKGTAQAGSNGRFYFNGETVDRVPRPVRLAHKMSIYCIRVDGSSMEPIYPDGEILFIDSKKKPFVDRDGVIELHPENDGEDAPAFIKRIVRIGADWVELKEWQPKERVFRVPMRQIRAMHLVLRNTDIY